MFNPRLPLIAALVSVTALFSSPCHAEITRQWSFRVYLDEKLIGRHNFILRKSGEEHAMHVEAALTVKILGLTLYRYTHTAHERWRGNCLQAVSTRTDDNGDQFRVDSEWENNTLIALTAQQRIATTTCPMTFAYWNPAILEREYLLNTQTGAYEKVGIEKIGNTSIRARGSEQSAMHYRIGGLLEPIDLWYSSNGDWLGLASRVAGGKSLRYELE